MSFNVLYIDNDPDMGDRLQEIVAIYNDRTRLEEIQLEYAKDPEQAAEKLEKGFDLVIADVFYGTDEEPLEDFIPRLDDIIKSVKEWSKNEGLEIPIPIIAFTGMEDAFAYCLENKQSLYDIWEKSTATEDYVVWRLARLSEELSRSRPDAYLQRLIRNMNRGASWHDKVVEMTRQYHYGRTEQDQVMRGGTSIRDIAFKLKVYDECRPLWDAMAKWEWLGRAVSPGTRGHARHVINVFWMGYYLLHHDGLSMWFRQVWKNIDRGGMKAYEETEPLEALSDAWFYAGLFHDCAGAVEKSAVVAHYLQEVLKKFDNFVLVVPQVEEREETETFTKEMESLLHEFHDDRLQTLLRKSIEPGIKSRKPDHGLVAALYFRNHVRDGEQGCYSREAARAMVLHNLFPEMIAQDKAVKLSWESEPIACLLLLCDQIQTWDRERGDETFWGPDAPERAELVKLRVTGTDPKPLVEMSINYLIPLHLRGVPELLYRLREKLKEVLRKHPILVLGHLDDWPFDIRIKFYLDGEPLDTDFSNN